MNFALFTDTSANLPTPLLLQRQIRLVALHYLFDGQEHQCLDTTTFDGDSYYAAIKAGRKVTTSQVPPQRFVEAFTPELEQGRDVLYVGMSSGISGTFASAQMAAEQLREDYPQRQIRLVDTLAAALGEGILVLKAADCRDAGLDAEATARAVEAQVPCLYQSVLLEDLMYLHRGGRLSGASAVIGTVLGIRPMLKGDREGHLVVTGKVRGRGAGLERLVKQYETLVRDAENQIVAIVYTTNREEAQELGRRLCAIAQPKELMVVQYEPVTGSYIGPGGIALFFSGDQDVRGQ